MKTVRFLGMASVTLTALTFGLGCQADPNAQGSTSAPAETVTLATRSSRPVKSVTLDVPEEWTHKTQGAWTVYDGPDRTSIAIGALDPNDVNAERLAEGAKALGATDVQTSDEQATPYGPRRLPAHAADGTCKIGSSLGRIGYVVAELEGERVMIIHVAPREANDETLRAGRTIAASLRKLGALRQ